MWEIGKYAEQQDYMFRRGDELDGADGSYPRDGYLVLGSCPDCTFDA
jgi:hypothetical protein